MSNEKNKKSRDADEEFWEIAQEEIRSGEEVTIQHGNFLAICATLDELFDARAEIERIKESEHD